MAGMYLQKQFEESRIDVMHQLMRDHPLATLVTVSDDGLQADHIPLLVTPEGNLIGHVARANPMLERMQRDASVLAVFQGPQAYISPSWYATKAESGKVVPTWNYAVVHARGKLVVHDDAIWLREQIEALTQAMERNMPEPWLVSDAPDDFTARMIGAVVGIEIVVSQLEGKWKVSQNHPAANRQGVIEGLARRGGNQDLMMAALVERFGK